jgi:hypothetical protein
MFESLTGADLAAALVAATDPAAARDPAALSGPAASGSPDPADPAEPGGADDPTGRAGQSLGDLVDQVAACHRLIGWATGRQARAVSSHGAGGRGWVSAAGHSVVVCSSR